MSVFHFMDLFLLGSVFGWILELFYRRIFSVGKWINPGFLVGPWVPLYGFGLVSLYLLCERLSFLPIESVWQKTVLTVIICGTVMTFIEFLAGLIFIYGMKIQLWDYSHRPGNILGLVCPLFYLIWTAIAAIYILFLHRPISEFIISRSYGIWEFFAMGLIYGVFLTDVGYSLSLSIRISGLAKNYKMIIHYEKLKKSILAEIKRLKQKQNFLLPFHSASGLRESIRKYAFEKLQQIEKTKKKK